MAYQKRIVDEELVARLESTGAVVIEGPKACGKTETARQAARSEVLLDVDPAARQAIAVDPAFVLDGATPRLIDEWQREPEIWNYVRRAVDDRGEPGQFILTGSSVPPDDETRHVGAGRITRLRMRPMTLFETGHSIGTISLSEVLGGRPVASRDPGLTIPAIAERVSVGGWPGFIGRTVPQTLRGLRGYLDEIRRVDINRLDGVRRDPDGVGRLLRSLARNVATSASASALAADTGGAGGTIKEHTVLVYLEALGRLMIVEDLPAWAPNLRSRARLRAAAKRHFVDPSLAVAALQATPSRLLSDLNLLGFLFESMVVRDLRVYAQALEGQVLHYRDSNGLEADAIIEIADGQWAAFEVKLGLRQVDEAAANLLKLRGRVDTDMTGQPLALGVIVGTGFGYLRPDGVAVIPIGALRP